MLDIRYEIRENLKQHPSEDDPLAFGTIFTDHMFIMNYETGKGWHDARIIPYQPLSLEPSSMVFHYGQEMFEGLKAYKAEDGRTLLFRPDKNAKRANKSNQRLCIPEIPEEDFVQAVKTLVKVDESWVPDRPGTSLYIRPFIIATDPFLGVRPSKTYMFIVILSPVGPYYKEGLDPVKIWVEDEYVRAVKGGIGEAKTGGNYVASLASQVKAAEEGYSQVLWLDGIERKYIEEVGAMNIFFKIDGKIITPKLNGSILPGITRDSVLKLGKAMGYEVEEKQMDIQQVFADIQNGTITEAFGTGTAAVISPVGHLYWKGSTVKLGNGGIGELSQKLYDTLTGIQLGKEEDTFGWVHKL